MLSQWFRPEGPGGRGGAPAPRRFALRNVSRGCLGRLAASIVGGMSSSSRPRPRPTTAAVLLALGLAACGGTSSTSTSTSGSPAGATPSAPGPRIYVSDETGTEVVVIDTGTRQVLQRIQVGKRPRAV